MARALFVYNQSITHLICCTCQKVRCKFKSTLSYRLCQANSSNIRLFFYSSTVFPAAVYLIHLGWPHFRQSRKLIEAFCFNL